MPLDAVADRLASRGGGEGDVRAILTDAAALCRRARLSAPAEAAFVEKPGITEPWRSDLGSLRLRSAELLETLASTDSAGATLGKPAENHEEFVAALRYAEALVRQEDVNEALGRLDAETAPMQTRLTGPDRKRVEDFLVYRNVRGRFETLDSLISLWERFVTRIEKTSQSYAYDDYTDRLVSRDSLEDAISLLSPLASGDVAHNVCSLDSRFAAATHEITAPLRTPDPWKPQAWWWFRVPRQIGDQFRSQLQGIAPAAAAEAFAEHSTPSLEQT